MTKLKAFQLPATLLMLSLFLFGCDSLRSIYDNNKAVEKLAQGELGQAEQELLMSIGGGGDQAITHLNLGLAYEMGKNYDRSGKEYLSALRNEILPPDIQYFGQFNAGNSFGLNKKVDEALNYYQKALDHALANNLDPNWINEVKNNIEVLTLTGGQGGGGGEDQKPQDGDNQDQKNKQAGSPDQKENPEPDDQKGQQQKAKFQSEKLTQEDVRKILEELKSQEKKIRALEYGGKEKESSPGHDW